MVSWRGNIHRVTYGGVVTHYIIDHSGSVGEYLSTNYLMVLDWSELLSSRNIGNIDYRMDKMQKITWKQLGLEDQIR